MADAVRMALVGAGRMGSFHARALAGSAAVELVAVADPDVELAGRVAAATGATAYPSPRDLLERDDLEAWLIAAPTPAHPELVEQALAAGLHVLCEKPLALDPERSDALGSQAIASGRVLQVGFWRRFAPPWARAREAVAAGAIGRPLLVRLAQWDAQPPPASFCDPAVSGGLAIDCGVHEFDLAEWLTGSRIERVAARSLAVIDDAIGRVGDVDNLVALLDLSGGGAAVVDLTRNARFGDDVRTELLGSEGAIFIETLSAAGARLATSDGIRAIPGSETPDAMAAGVLAQAEAFAAAVRGRPVELPGAAASSRAVRVGRAVQAAAAGGDWVLLPD